MNTELRTKILNRYRESAEQENTQELEAMKQAREGVDRVYPEAFELANKLLKDHIQVKMLKLVEH